MKLWSEHPLLNCAVLVGQLHSFQSPYRWYNFVFIGSLPQTLTTQMMKSAPLNISTLNGVFTALSLTIHFH